MNDAGNETKEKESVPISQHERMSVERKTTMWKWCLMACAMFCAINWFIIPQFPIVRQWLSPLTIYSAIGLSGIFVVLTVLFSRDK